MAAGTQATPPGMTETSEEEEHEAAEEVKGSIPVRPVSPRGYGRTLKNRDARNPPQQGAMAIHY